MRRKMCVAVSMLALVMSLVGCGLSGDGGSGKNDKDEKDAELEIEMSASKETIGVGEKVEVTIENFDDLKKVEIEVDDEDIAEAELDDDTITIEGKEEGKTTITVSAKDCEDVTVTVKVTASDGGNDDGNTAGGETGSGNNTGGNGGHASGGNGGIEAPSEARLYEHYVAEIPSDVWSGFLDMDDADEYTIAVMEMFKKCNIKFNAEMNLDLSNATEGTGEFVVDLDDFMEQFRVAMQDEDLFIEFMELAYGETIDSETREALLEMQGDFIDMLVTDEENIVTKFDWSYDSEDAMLTISGDSRSGVYYIHDDGSFEYMAGDGDTDVWLTFVPVK
jgi:hypothetical protein